MLLFSNGRFICLGSEKNYTNNRCSRRTGRPVKWNNWGMLKIILSNGRQLRHLVTCNSFIRNRIPYNLEKRMLWRWQFDTVSTSMPDVRYMLEVSSKNPALGMNFHIMLIDNKVFRTIACVISKRRWFVAESPSQPINWQHSLWWFIKTKNHISCLDEKYK